jgi:ech hydrogenase subunit D
MNRDHQEVIRVEAGQLVEQVQTLRQQGYRLVQIDCVRGEDFELNYSLGKDLSLLTLRVTLSGGSPRIRSLSGVYGSAALYENELHDLFGVQVEGLNPDYRGSFYRTRVKIPYNPPTETSVEAEGAGAAQVNATDGAAPASPSAKEDG